MYNIITNDNKKIEDMIYEIRGKQVMLDSDLAYLYQCKNGTKTINLAVKRHINRFPERFMFQLSENECQNLSRFQFETLKGRGHNIKYLPYAFTEQGVAMLATVLRTEVAEEMSVRIMDAFVLMRKFISGSLIEQRYINNQVFKNTEDIKLLQESFSKFEEKRIINEIYFDGQIYDAYSKILDILSTAKNDLIIIDRYADKSVLDMISKLNIKTTIICKKNELLNDIDIKKYNRQYSNLKIIYNNSFHDRYFILDKSIVYHCGSSINHAGNKTFSINLINDDIVKESLIKKATSIIE